MTAHALFAIPGDLATLTGGYGYDRRVLALLPACGVATLHMQLPGSFPFPGDDDVARTIRMMRATRDDAVLLVDGLAFGALPSPAIATLRQKIVALVHHPLGYEAGLSPVQSRALVASERAALTHAAHIVVTSAPTRTTLVDYFGVDPERIAVAEPGTDPAARARPADAGEPILLTVGSIVPRKAFDVLVRALAGIAHLPWRMRIVGSPERSPETATSLRAQIVASGLASRIELVGELDEQALGRAYGGADLFVLPSLYEGYGMALAEAMARGLPIVCTTGGAAAQTVPDGAGLKVPPGDAAALRDALASALADGRMRQRLADESWRAGQLLPRWRDTAARIAAVIEAVAGRKTLVKTQARPQARPQARTKS